MALLHRLFGHIPNFSVTIEALGVALVFSALCAFVVTSVLRQLLSRALTPGHADDEHDSVANRRLSRTVMGVSLLVMTLIFIPPFLDLFGEPLKGGLRLRTITTWLYTSGLQIVIIVTIVYAVHRATVLLLKRFEHRMVKNPSPGDVEHYKRARTLASLIERVSSVVIVAAAFLMVLEKLNVNTAPILTGAGILGLAVGFGAQTLVKDVITGFFLILENQIRVGDIAEINGVGGQVELIRLRTVVLRDMRGAVHIFPCGSINTISNLTKDFAFAVVDVEVPLHSDIPAAMEALREIGRVLRLDVRWKFVIIDDLEMLGIESISTTSVIIRTRIKTVPQRQWDIARELRFRITQVFSEKGIDLRIVQRMLMEPTADRVSLPSPANDSPGA